MDQDTKKVLTDQDLLRELVSHQGWKVARKILAEKILDLQNAFNIDERTATTMLRDLQARKYAATLLFDLIREIEGTAAQAEDNKELKSTKSHIYIKPDEKD